MESSNPTLFCVIHGAQQADGTAGAQTPMCGSRTNLPPDDIRLPPAKDMMNDLREESDEDGKMQRPNPKASR